MYRVGVTNGRRGEHQRAAARSSDITPARFAEVPDARPVIGSPCGVRKRPTAGRSQCRGNQRRGISKYRSTRTSLITQHPGQLARRGSRELAQRLRSARRQSPISSPMCVVARRYVVPSGVPVALSIAISTAPFAMVAATPPVPEAVTSPVNAVMPPPLRKSSASNFFRLPSVASTPINRSPLAAVASVSLVIVDAVKLPERCP